MKEMSSFVSSLEADPEEQRFNKAAIHLRALRFERLSDDHVISLALLHELGSIYRNAFTSHQVLKDQHVTQEDALRTHLEALKLPSCLEGLEPHEVKGLVEAWDNRWQDLPRPFDQTLNTFVLYAKTHLGGSKPMPPAHYQSR
jgi:hypothetical protein